MEEKKEGAKCPTCKGNRVVSILGAGGDYENWPCHTCRPVEYRATLVDQYSSGYDGGSD